jgi:hypothetical protein
MTGYLTQAVTDFGLDIVRMDFNQDPAAAWAMKDGQDAGEMMRIVYPLHSLYSLHSLHSLHSLQWRRAERCRLA